MRLLFVTHSFPPRDRPLSNVGGMQRVAVDLHRALSEHPRVILGTEAIYTSWRWTGPRTALFLPRLLLTLPRRIRREQIDVVVFSSMVTAALAPLLCRRLAGRPVRFVAIAHGHDVTMAFPPYQRWLRRVFGALDGVLPVSRATAEACAARGARPDQIEVCPNGIRLDRFGHLPDRDAARHALLAAHALPGDAFLLASVGRQVKRKGTAWFVRHVLPRLAATPDGVAHLLVAGSGPEQEAIVQAAAEAGVADRLRLLGRVPETDLATLLRGADVFVMPNVPVEGDMEGFGVVMLEAGLCELPVVATALEGIQDVVTDGANGFLVPPENPEAFAEQLRVLMRDHELRDLLGVRAREHVTAAFSWPAVARRTVRSLRDLVGRAVPQPH